MKYSPLCAFVLLTLVSCRVYNRITEISDRTDGTTELRLDQNPQVSVAGHSGKGPVKEHSWSFTSAFRFVQHTAVRPEITTEFRLKGVRLPNRPDSVIDFILDGEKIKLFAEKSGPPDAAPASPDAAGSENIRLLIPENLWVSVAHAGTVQYRIFWAGNSIDVVLNPAETAVLRQFFQRACVLRDAAFPEIPTNPPGLKKW